MAISDVIKKKIGRELREWIFLGVRTGARQRVVHARRYWALGDTEQAITHMKIAVDTPHRIRAKIDTFIAAHGISLLQEAVALNGDVTLAEIDAELTTLENYAQGLVDAKNGGATWEEIAINIETSIELEARKWIFPLPENYVSVWSE